MSDKGEGTGEYARVSISDIGEAIDPPIFISPDSPFTLYVSPVAICSKHGEGGGDFYVQAWSGADSFGYKSPPLCAKCFVDFIAANVTNVSPKPDAA